MTHADREAAMCADEVVDQSKDSLVSRRLHFCVPLQLSLSVLFCSPPTVDRSTRMPNPRQTQLSAQHAQHARGEESSMLTRNFLELQHGCTGPRRLAYTHSAMNTSRSDSLLVGDRVGSKVKATLFDNGEITGPAGIHFTTAI